MSEQRRRQWREDLFAREYVIDLDAKRAAIAVGFSEAAGKQRGYEMLGKPFVQRRISNLLAKRMSKLEISSQQVLQKLADLAFFDVRKLYNEDGSLKPIPQLDEETASAIAGFEQFARENGDSGVTTRIRFLARTEALKLLGQYCKLFSEQAQPATEINVQIIHVGQS